MLVRGIAMGALPAAELHEVAAELLLALIERRAPNSAPSRERLTWMNRRVVDLPRRLGASLLNVFFLQLKRVEAGKVDPAVVDRRASVGHPVGKKLAHSGP